MHVGGFVSRAVLTSSEVIPEFLEPHISSHRLTPTGGRLKENASKRLYTDDAVELC